MARRTRRRFRRRTRWSSNIKEINAIALNISQGSWSGSETLATNPVQDVLGVSQVYTVKNFDINFTLEAASTATRAAIEAVTAYIMYVPQGMNISENYNLEHPEYIMNYKYLGSPASADAQNEEQQFQPIRVRTRLSRKLNTGDSIILFLKGTSTDTGGIVQLSGLVRWWTKAN